jgi:hypothetical protein
MLKEENLMLKTINGGSLKSFYYYTFFSKWSPLLLADLYMYILYIVKLRMSE